MKEEIAMPMQIGDFDFDLNSKTSNKEKLFELLDSRLTKKTLKDFEPEPNRRYKLIQVMGIKGGEFVLYRPEDEQISYYMEYHIHNITPFNTPYITQVAVWRDAGDPNTYNIVPTIFWKHLFPMVGRMKTDNMQTRDGRTFWTRRIREAWKLGNKVYWLNKDTETYQEIARTKDLEIYQHLIYGSTTEYKTQLLIILDKNKWIW